MSFFLSLWSCLLRDQNAFICYYGEGLSVRDLVGVGVAIVDPAHVIPSQFKDRKTLLAGYVSFGEWENSRDYGEKLGSQDFVVGENPFWKGNMMMDIRSPDWQKLLNKRIAQIVSEGFDGIFLDTLDVITYLESSDPKKFAGSMQALADFVASIKKKYPAIKIYPNNGLEALDLLGASIDGLVVEELYTHFDEKKRRFVEPNESIVLEKEAYIDSYVKKFKRPVYVLIYSDGSSEELIQNAKKRAEKKGYVWYITKRNLDELGQRPE